MDVVHIHTHIHIYVCFAFMERHMINTVFKQIMVLFNIVFLFVTQMVASETYPHGCGFQSQPHVHPMFTQSLLHSPISFS